MSRERCSSSRSPWSSSRLVIRSTGPLALSQSRQSSACIRSWLRLTDTPVNGQPFRSAYIRVVMATHVPSEANSNSYGDGPESVPPTVRGSSAVRVIPHADLRRETRVANGHCDRGSICGALAGFRFHGSSFLVWLHHKHFGWVPEGPVGAGLRISRRGVSTPSAERGERGVLRSTRHARRTDRASWCWPVRRCRRSPR